MAAVFLVFFFMLWRNRANILVCSTILFCSVAMATSLVILPCFFRSRVIRNQETFLQAPYYAIKYWNVFLEETSKQSHPLFRSMEVIEEQFLLVHFLTVEPLLWNKSKVKEIMRFCIPMGKFLLEPFGVKDRSLQNSLKFLYSMG